VWRNGNRGCSTMMNIYDSPKKWLMNFARAILKSKKHKYYGNRELQRWLYSVDFTYLCHMVPDVNIISILDNYMNRIIWNKKSTT
jgi:hypothetical protein